MSYRSLILGHFHQKPSLIILDLYSFKYVLIILTIILVTTHAKGNFLIVIFYSNILH